MGLFDRPRSAKKISHGKTQEEAVTKSAKEEKNRENQESELSTIKIAEIIVGNDENIISIQETILKS